MGGVDHVNQHILMREGFENVAHFKNWYKKAFLGLPEFSLLQGFKACFFLGGEQPRETNTR